MAAPRAGPPRRRWGLLAVDARASPQLPARAWPLTAPESVLLRNPDAPAIEPFKLALLELIARRAVTLRGVWMRRRWRRSPRAGWLLCDGPDKASVDEPALVPVGALHTRLLERRHHLGVPFGDRTEEVPGVPLDVFVSAARRNGGYRAYAKRDVAGSLWQRDLLTRIDKRTPEATPAGEQAVEELETWLEIGRGAPAGFLHDPVWLRAYLAGTGAAVFLVDAATDIAGSGRPLLRNIVQALPADTPTEIRGLDFTAIADGLDFGFAAVDAAFLAPELATGAVRAWS